MPKLTKRIDQDEFVILERASFAERARDVSFRSPGAFLPKQGKQIRFVATLARVRDPKHWTRVSHRDWPLTLRRFEFVSPVSDQEVGSGQKRRRSRLAGILCSTPRRCESAWAECRTA